ncbi:MAG: tRNA 2-thiouridine(34) synthase MnmA [bacterium]|nr:tRNA 2-thiouridine(34) synthase MnmA [bacterium]
MSTKKKKVFVGLSGGVDSAVSAALLQKEGYDVTGVFIRIALPGYPCSAGADKIEAMRVAAHLDIPFLELDLSKEYAEEVFTTSIQAFARGRTPNPDALCNRQIKFGAFFDFARARGADYIATGHYAQLRESKISETQKFPAKNFLSPAPSRLRTFPQPSFTSLLAGADAEKDQSYFLWMVPEAVLRHTLFPVGGMQKARVRELAKKFGLPNSARKDSQGLCFLGDISIEQMLNKELSPQLGDVLAENGKVVGTHEGAVLYTLGQRHGFTIFSQDTHTVPHFVIGKDIEKNTITTSTQRYPTGATTTQVALREHNWIGPVSSGPCSARFRYRQKLIPAVVEVEKNIATLLEPHYVPLGQSLVVYKGEVCLGGGIVEDTELC